MTEGSSDRGGRRLVLALTVLAITAGVLLWVLVGGPPGASPTSGEGAVREGPPPRSLASVPPALQGSALTGGATPARPRWRLRAVDPDRAPVAGARVHAVPPRATYVRTEGRWQGATDPEGRVEVPMEAVAPGEVLVVQAPGFLPATVRARPAASEARDDEVVLERGSAVIGTVLDPGGEPVPGVEVRARPGNGALPADVSSYLPGPDAAGRVASAQTDAEGRFRLLGLGSFPVMVSAHRPGWVNLLGPESHLRGPKEDVRLVLHPQARAGVRAIDAVTRLPIPLFAAGPKDVGDPPLRTTTLASLLRDEPPTGWDREQGEWWMTFTVTQFPGGSRPQHVPVQVSAAGYRRTSIDVPLRYLGEEGPREALDVHLEPLPSRDALGRVEFRVSYPALRRAPDVATILVHASVLDLPPGTGDVRFLPNEQLKLALEEGRATVELPAGEYKMALGGPFPCPWPPTWTDVVVPREGVVAVDLTFGGALVRVKVVDADGQLVLFFFVQVSQKAPASSSFRTHAWLLEDESMADEARTYGVRPAEMVLGVLAGKPVGLSVVADGFKPWQRGIEAPAEGQTVDVEAVLEPFAR